MIYKTGLFLFCLVAGLFTACEKQASGTPASLPLTASSVAGNFTISSFTGVTDETALFDGYRFVFSENGTVTAIRDGSRTAGTWRFDDSDSTELKLDFASAPLNELNKGWHIEAITTEYMLLGDDDDSSAGDDHPSHYSELRFERE